MAVMIEGMEMPTGCISCDFCNPFVEEPYCRRLMKRVPKVTRLDNCPLIEVHEPHGDLIDRDAAKGSIKPWSPEDERSGCTFDTVKKLMHTMLNRAPIIIPASGEG